ncbi:MAG: ComF family protein [Flavobacteriales bacterium]|nr:ComF family protein [Flavobacteriales bacterium]
MRDLGDLALPRRCAGCDDPLHQHEQAICSTCLADFPRTRFHDDPSNPVERIFWGRIPLHAATALAHFDKRGRMQHMLHRLKYRGDRTVGHALGRMLGEELKASARFADVNAVLSVPLHPRKERDRGYNQAEVLAEGLREALGTGPVNARLVRAVHTESQTRKSRLERWRNVKDAFVLHHGEVLTGRHVLLIDDVVTTGATLEGCAAVLQDIADVRVSVATVAFA